MQKYGVREICEVVLKAKHTQKIGNKVFYKNEPVMYFDTLKTSSLEGNSSTVYAEGGRGNTRLVAWEGERTLTFNMEDALISSEGLMILTGAGLIDAVEDKQHTWIYQHMVETTDLFEISEGSEASVDEETGEEIPATAGSVTVYVKNEPYLPTDKRDNYAYVMIVYADGSMSEPFIPTHAELTPVESGEYEGMYAMVIEEHDNYVGGEEAYTVPCAGEFAKADHLVVDYYVPRRKGAQQIEITPDKFGGNYYLEASTLFRDTNGVDLPAEFIIPNCKVQSNFTFSMASTGDPSTFNFVLDAFPDFTKFDRSKKVLCAIQVIDPMAGEEVFRTSTCHDEAHDELFK